MIANYDILRAVLQERRTIQPLTKEFYAPCVAELIASDLFECVFLEDDEYGNDFFLYFIFPRDGRSLRIRDGRSPVGYKGIGLGLCLCIWQPIAAYGPMSAFGGRPDEDGTGRNWLLPEKLQMLPAPDWVDVEGVLVDILRRHSIAIMTREEAMMPLTALQLSLPTGSSITDDLDHVFFALFNNDY